MLPKKPRNPRTSATGIGSLAAKNKAVLPLLAATAALVLTGCSTASSPSVPYVQAEYEYLHWADGSKLTVNRVNLADATEAIESQDFKLVSNTEQWSLGKEFFEAFGIDAQGNLVGSMISDQGVDPKTGELFVHSQIGSVKDGDFVPFPEPKSLEANQRVRQVLAGQSDGENIVWAETSDTTIVAGSWQLYSKPSRAQEPVLVASSDAGDDATLISLGGSEIQPVIYQDRIYWHESIRATSETPVVTTLKSVDLQGKEEPREEGTGLAYPVALDKSLAAFTLPPMENADREVPEEFAFPQPQGISLIELNAKTSELLQVSSPAPEEAHFGMLEGSEKTLTFSFNGETFMVDTENKRVTVFEEPQAASLTGLALCGDMATWSYMDQGGENLGKQYVYNVKDQTLRVVSEPRLAGTSTCHDRYLGWSIRDLENDGAYSTEVLTQWKR